MSYGPLSQVILDEIGLEGLEGISLSGNVIIYSFRVKFVFPSGLWIRLSTVIKIPLPFTNHFQEEIWAFILKVNEHLLFYERPEALEDLRIYDRFTLIDPELGVPVSPVS